MLDKLAIAINALWLWCCLAPALLGIAIFMIKMASGAKNHQSYEQSSEQEKYTSEPKEHKHGWRRKPNEGRTEKKNKWFTTYHEKYECDDCGEKENRSVDFPNVSE